MIITNLASLGEGETATVKSLGVGGAMRRRLFDLGLTPGAKVACEHKSPAGDPVAYTIRGAVIALRNSDARNITVARMS